MTADKRLAVCYAAPGLNLLTSSGPTRNVLSLAEALGEWADVTVAFRAVLEPVESRAFRVIAIDSSAVRGGDHHDDNGVRGLHPLRHLAYCRRVRSFARRQAAAFDVVLEKGWRLSGLLATACVDAGIPAVVIENDVRLWNEPVRGIATLGKYALHEVAERVAASACRRVPVIVAETEEMKAKLAALRAIPPDRIEAVGLGVDHQRFRPADRAAARARLGIRSDRPILLYVGAMDEYHDLAPVIDALGRFRAAPAELHVVGEGEYLARYRAQAAEAGIASRFYGRVPHATVPEYIAAADLCLAPYRTNAFHDGEVTFSTLKIPEYLACGRPVATVPSATLRRLVVHEVNGFILPNEASTWEAFFRTFPDRDRLARMGEAAVDTASAIGWDKTARRYLDICARLVRESTRPAARPTDDRLPRQESGGVRVN